MQNKKLSLIIAIVLISSSLSAQKTIEDLYFLLGTWKVENKASYENWKMVGKTEIKGFAYKLVGNDQQITETLIIKLKDKQIIYEATVPNQNEGKSIEFVLKSPLENYYSFENPSHDFPKKIQYIKKSDSKIFVKVMGDKDEGFSYYLISE